MRRSDPTRILVPVCFFFSGAAGLALEVVWTKYLSLLLGNSVHGVATVVAAFLGGLGIGAALSGRRASALRNPLLAYAMVEAVVGLLALVSPLAYRVARPLFSQLYEALGGTGPLFHGVRFVLLFATLLIPTIAMGASLPLIVEDASRRRPREASASVARLYAINTGGAVAGTIVAGFLAIPGIGLAMSAIAAGLVDLAIAAVVRTARIPAPVEEVSKEERAAPRKKRRSAPAAASEEISPPLEAAPFATWLLPAFALSGLAAILYQIAWTRLLSVPFGGITYAFSAILAIYLLGLALGAAAAQRVLRRVRVPVVLFGLLQAALAASVAVGLHALQRLPHWQTEAIAAAQGSIPKLLSGEAIIIATLLLPPTLLLGALFPVAVAIRRGGGAEASSAAGAVYSANTVGSIAGSLLTAYFLIPGFGAPKAILGAATLNAVLALAALLGGEPSALRTRRRGGGVLVAATAAYVLLWMPTWSQEQMSIGLIRLLRAYQYGGEALVHRVIDGAGTRPDFGTLLFYREGPVANVAVLEVKQQRTLLINGKADATTGTGADMVTQVLVGQLPFLVTPKAADAFVIGYGSGVTTAATLTHDVREVQTVELEPAVVEAAPFFRDSAGDPLQDPRHKMLIEDAGLVLRSENRDYDVIVSEPSNFWIAGMSSLFSDDFYKVAASRLRPGGVLCQWVQCYQISPEAIHTVIRTLSRTFPYGQIFFVPSSSDLIILASPREDVPLDLAAWTEAFKRSSVAENLASVGIEEPADLLRFYRGRLDRVAAENREGPVNTDDNGWLEHRAPLELLTQQSDAEILGWDDGAIADLARSLSAGGPAAVAAAMPLLDKASARASEVEDTVAATALRRVRLMLK